MKRVDWAYIRKQFPVTDNCVYLNCAAAAPICKAAMKEGAGFYEQLCQNGDVDWDLWLKKKEDVRVLVAEYLNAEPEEIAFLQNTSIGMNLIAMYLKQYKNILTMQDEFPSSTIPWSTQGFNLRFIAPQDKRYPINLIEKEIATEIEILITSYVQYKTGFRQDLNRLGELCKKRNLIYVVNATQGMGVFPVDVKRAGLDFLVAGCHKWAMGGYGVSVLYINQKYFLQKPPIAGWLSVNSPMTMDNRSLDYVLSASVVESGCPNLPNILTLGGSLKLFKEIGFENVTKRILYLSEYMVDNLRARGYEIVSATDDNIRSGIVSIKVDNPLKYERKLAKKGIYVAARKDSLRASVHIYNNEDDIDKFIDMIAAK